MNSFLQPQFQCRGGALQKRAFQPTLSQLRYRPTTRNGGGSDTLGWSESFRDVAASSSGIRGICCKSRQKKEEALHSSRAGKRRRGITNWCCRLSVNGSDPSPEATSALSVEKREQGSGHPAVSLGKGPRGSRFDKTQASGSEKRGVFRLGARATPEILARRPRSPAVLS